MKRHEKIKAVPERLQSMKKRIKQSLALVGILIMSLSLSGCEKLVETDVSAETRSQTSYSKSENTTPQSSSISETDVLLPEGWTMDDLRNLLVINGKTLTLPTTLNKIMELDDKFSYEVEYIDEKSPYYNGKQKGFYVDILYDNELMFMTTFPSDENNVNKILDKNIYHASFGKINCIETDIDVNTSCGLNFDSSNEDIINTFGEPNKYDLQQSNRSYEFYDDIYTCDLTFKLNTEDRIIRVRMLFKTNDKIGEHQYE